MQTRHGLSFGSVLLVLIAGCGEEAKPKAAPAAKGQAAATAPGPQAPAPAPPSQPQSSGFVGNAPSSPAAHVVRGKEHTQVRGMLQQMGRFYNQYLVENNNQPPTTQQMIAYVQRDHGQLAKALQEGTIIMPARKGVTGASVIAHEKNLDLNQIREVLLGDGSVQKMTDAQLKAAMRN